MKQGAGYAQIGWNKGVPTAVGSMQLRCSPRICVRYPTSIQTDDGASEGILFDLSASGCRMQSNVTLTPGKYLAAASLQNPDLESPLAVEVSIVRCGTKTISLVSSFFDTQRVIVSESRVWSKVAKPLSSPITPSRKN